MLPKAPSMAMPQLKESLQETRAEYAEVLLSCALIMFIKWRRSLFQALKGLNKQHLEEAGLNLPVPVVSRRTEAHVCLICPTLSRPKYVATGIGPKASRLQSATGGLEVAACRFFVQA